MHLNPGEKIQKVFYHHPTPFIFNLLKLILATLPFYFILFVMKDSFGFAAIVTMHIVVILIFSITAVYITLIYWLDRLIITNKRVVFIDWKYLTVKTEHEATLNDIQDITSTEKGLIALIPTFDYGSIVIKTASAQTLIDFKQAPDPDGIKKYIQNLIVHDHYSSYKQ